MTGYILEPGAGRVLPTPSPSAHGTVTIKVATPAVTVFETHRPQGDAGGPGPHSHPGFDETFYVVGGEWVFTVGERRVLAGAGTVVHVPRGAFHSFHSTGAHDSKLVGVTAPGGIEDYFEEAAHTNRYAAGERHGIEFVTEA